MKRTSAYFIALVAGGTLSLTGCGGEETPDVTVNVDTTEQVVEQEGNQVFYQIPTPNEFFTVIKEIGGKGETKLMNPVANSSSYVDTKTKALNFGVYSADLAYASCYDLGKSSLEYFKAVEKMGDELDISAAFDESVFKRIEENLENGDSLLTISNDTYFNAYSYLEENDRGDILSLVVAGGWVESMYIVTTLAGDFKENNPILARIAEQKYTLDNIVDFMSRFAEESQNVQEALSDFLDIQMIFETLEVVEQEMSTENTGDMLVLSGNAEYKFTAESYADLKDKVKEVRNKITNVAN